VNFIANEIEITSPLQHRSKESQSRTQQDVDAFCAAAFGVNNLGMICCIFQVWHLFSYVDIRNNILLWIEGPLDQSAGC
jgi:hypothetical protein